MAQKSSASQNNAPPQGSTDSNHTLYQQLRNEWNTGSKCMVFSSVFKQWIYTNILEIKNEKGEQILTVKNGIYDSDQSDVEDETISLERFSNNIQPTCITNSNNNNINNKWTKLLNSQMINESLYAT
eukprot:90932_1